MKSRSCFGNRKNPATSGGNSWTALHYAATGRSVETCRTLLDHRANVEARSMDGCTPFYYAYRAGGKWMEIMVTLVTNETNNTWRPCEKRSHQENKKRNARKSVLCISVVLYIGDCKKSEKKSWIPIDWRCFQTIMWRSRVGNLVDWRFKMFEVTDYWISISIRMTIWWQLSFFWQVMRWRSCSYFTPEGLDQIWGHKMWQGPLIGAISDIVAAVLKPEYHEYHHWSISRDVGQKVWQLGSSLFNASAAFRSIHKMEKEEWTTQDWPLSFNSDPENRQASRIILGTNQLEGSMERQRVIA